MKKLLLFGIIFSLITLVQFSQINYRYTGRGEFYFKGKNLTYGDIVTVDEFMYMDNFEVVDQGSTFPEIVIDFTEVDIDTYPQVTGETPEGDIDGQNQTFTLQEFPVTQDSVELTLTEYPAVQDEDLTGTVNGQNQTFTTQETPIVPGTLEIVFDESTNTVVDDGAGNLSGESTGTVNYTSGTIVFATQPSTSVVQDYNYITETTITDNASGVLSDGGSIDFTTGILQLASQPQTGSLLVQDYTYTKQTLQEFEVDRLQNVKIEVEIDQSNVQDLTLYYNNTTTNGIPLDQDYEAVVNSKNFYKIIIENSNDDAIYTVTFKDNDLISE